MEAVEVQVGALQRQQVGAHRQRGAKGLGQHRRGEPLALPQHTGQHRCRRVRVEMLADSDPQLAREIRQVAFAALSRVQAQLLILGRITALEKVGSFILEMVSRLSAGNGNSVALPMSRYDIADYLAVSVETVSRSLTDLKQRGVIKLAGTRTVRIVNRNALEDGERSGLAA